MDKDFDGKLSREEIVQGFREMEQEDPEGEADKIMANIDFDDNGSIEFTEWCTATMDKRKLLSKERLKAAFSIFDQNGNGSISFEEVKALIGHGEINDEAFKEMISEMDIDGDGEISFQEFEKMMGLLIKSV